MEDFKHIDDEKVRELSLKSEALLIDTDDLEEAHYVHTVNAFVELIVVYGYDKVIGDLRTAMGEKQW